MMIDKQSINDSNNLGDNGGSNSAAQVCEVCDNENMQCLCEVIVSTLRSKDNFEETFYWKSRKEHRKAIPKVILASGFYSLLDGIKSEKVTLDYEVVGHCEYANNDRCVQAQLLTLSSNYGIYSENIKKVPKKDTIDLTYDKNLKLYADISSHAIDIYPKAQSASPENIFYSSLRFLLLNELKDFEVNYRRLSVAECDTKNAIDEKKVVVHLVSVPSFEVEFNFSVSFEGEEVEEGLAKDFKEQNLSPDAARYGLFRAKTKFEVKYNQVKTEVEWPVPKLATTPLMNQVSTVFHKLNATKNVGGDSFPIALSLHSPVLHVNAKASFAGGDQLIQREGTLKLDPIFGGDAKLNLYQILSNVGGALGKTIRKGIEDLFPAVSKTGGVEDTEKRKKILQGDSKSSTIRAAGFFYFGGKLDFKGEVGLVPSNLGELKLPFDKAKLGAEIEFGLYAGVFAEARLWGFGGSFTAGLEIATAWEGYYYFDSSGFKIWHKGIYVKVYVEAEVGRKKDRGSGDDYSKENPDIGSLANSGTVDAKVEWEGKLMDGGSEDKPMKDTTEPSKEKKEETHTKEINVNIKLWRDQTDAEKYEEHSARMREAEKKYRELEASHLTKEQREQLMDKNKTFKPEGFTLPNTLKENMTTTELANFLKKIEQDTD